MWRRLLTFPAVQQPCVFPSRILETQLAPAALHSLNRISHTSLGSSHRARCPRHPHSLRRVRRRLVRPPGRVPHRQPAGRDAGGPSTDAACSNHTRLQPAAMSETSARESGAGGEPLPPTAPLAILVLTPLQQAVASAPWLYVPYPLQWGSPIFRPASIITMLAGALAAMIESVSQGRRWRKNLTVGKGTVWRKRLPDGGGRAWGRVSGSCPAAALA